MLEGRILTTRLSKRQYQEFSSV